MSTNEGPEVAATSPQDAPLEIDEPGTGPESGLTSATDDDVEGHYFPQTDRPVAGRSVP